MRFAQNRRFEIELLRFIGEKASFDQPIKRWLKRRRT